jgi:hypothetical protein
MKIIPLGQSLLRDGSSGRKAARLAHVLHFSHAALAQRFPRGQFHRSYRHHARKQIVGWYLDNNFGAHGFLLSKGHFRQLDPPNSAQTTVSRINDRGEITGTFLDLQTGTGRGFLFTDGHFTTIDVPGAIETAALGINKGEHIIRFCVDPNGDVHPFLLSATGFGTIPSLVVPAGINNRGEIVGRFGLVNKGTFSPVLFRGAVFTEANAISDRGEIVGDFADGTAERGFI